MASMMQVRENADVADSKSRPVCIESEKVRRARGHADRPLSEAELYEKFRTYLDAGGARSLPTRCSIASNIWRGCRREN
jgi:hypothetical protein